MGSFGGHALPGSFFIIFAAWWTVQIFRRHHRSTRLGGLPFKSTVTYHCDCLCGRARRWECEGWLKVFFTLVGLVLEVITARKDGRFAHLGNGQHATMFFMFGLTGAIDVLIHHGAPLPRGIQYVGSAMAFSVEAVLFMFHLHGRTPLDVMLHTLLVYLIYACAIVCILELRYRHSLLIALARCYFVMLQGTWFWQVGFILYNPIPGAVPWDGNDHDQMMVAPMIFAWHVGGVFIIILAVGVIVGWIYRCQGDGISDVTYGDIDMQTMRRGNGDALHVAVDLEDSSENETDFDKRRLLTNSSDD